MSHEVDPIVGRAIKLLLSNEENSSEELRALLEEQIRIRYGSRRAQPIANLAPNSDRKLTRCLSPTRRRPVTPGSDDSSSLSKKVSKNNDSESRSSTDSPTTLNYYSGSSEEDSEDLSLEILEENLCVFCKGGQTTSRNRFVECTDCHDQYHQNCADPPIEADVTDPRFVWYCDNCKKDANTSSKLGSTSSSSGTSGSAGAGSSIITLTPSNSNIIISPKVITPLVSSSTAALSSGSSGTSTAASSSSKTTSSSATLGISKSVLGVTRPQNTSYTLINKPLGGKFRLFKTAKRN